MNSLVVAQRGKNCILGKKYKEYSAFVVTRGKNYFGPGYIKSSGQDHLYFNGVEPCEQTTAMTTYSKCPNPVGISE